jgi:hypothetical protein
MNTTTKIAAGVGGLALALVSAVPAQAAGYTVTNSSRSDQVIAIWQHSASCSGRLFRLAPGKYATGVDSIKVYTDQAKLYRPGHKVKRLVDRHCYRVTGSRWRVVAVGD